MLRFNNLWPFFSSDNKVKPLWQVAFHLHNQLFQLRSRVIILLSKLSNNFSPSCCSTTVHNNFFMRWSVHLSTSSSPNVSNKSYVCAFKSYSRCYFTFNDSYMIVDPGAFSWLAYRYPDGPLVVINRLFSRLEKHSAWSYSVCKQTVDTAARQGATGDSPSASTAGAATMSASP